MLHSIFTIRDNKVGAYLPPRFYRSKGEFIRAIEEVVNMKEKSESNLTLYPEDFTAFELGTWEDTNCTYALHDSPMSLGLLIDFKKE